MHAHAGKTEGKQHGSNAGMNDTVGIRAAFQQASSSTPVLRRRGSTDV